MAVMTLEVLKQPFLLDQPQGGADHFNGAHFTVAHLWFRAGLPQALPACDQRQGIVKQTKTGENELVQTQGFPPQNVLDSFY
jgi:hypothetical protein